MPSGRDKYQSRENRARVRELFRTEWDPIGVGDNPSCSDEYDTYADKAYVMLMDEGASAGDIEAYLFDIATEYMGLTEMDGFLTERCSRAAAMLVALKPQFQVH